MFPCALVLMDLNTDSNPAPASTVKTWEINSPVNDLRGFAAFAITQLSQSGGASTPAAALVIEMSTDGTHWITLSDLGLTTASGDPDAQHLSQGLSLLRYVRVTVTATGGTRPAVSARVTIPSNLTLTAREL